MSSVFVIMRVLNKTTKEEIALNLVIADNIFSRMKGLLGKIAMPDGEAIWIKPCNGIHTFGMKFPIDVVFLNREYCVVAVRKNLKPNRIVPIIFNASSVIELPSGIIDRTSTKIGDTVEIA